MSEVKFTKGEWYAHPNGVGCGGIAIVNTPNVCVLTKVEDNANQYLIAAAPEMYDLLDSIENDAEQVPAWLWDKIQLTLAKARGES